MAILRLRSLSILACLVVPACFAPNTVVDLASNKRLYRDVPFSTRLPGDRVVFVAPLADVRSVEDLPLHDRGFPISYGGDDVWDRPIREMIDEVLSRQLADSGLFAGVSDKATPQSLILMASLESFTTGAVERVGGQQSFAEVVLRLRVLGPEDRNGIRATLHDQSYGDRKMTDPSFKPISPYMLVGSTLHTAMQKALTGLDGSNVGRSHVPLQLATPPGR